MKKVSATQLTHNTRKVIREVNETKEPALIMSYNLPVAILSPVPKNLNIDSTADTPQVNDRSKKKIYKTKGKKNPLANFVGILNAPDADPDAAINHNDIYDI